MKHLLLVEDESHLSIIMKYNLEAEGYQVTVAADGPSALAAVEAAPLEIDLVVLDIMLPGMSGYAVCEKLREQGLDTPVLIVSARTLAEDRIRGFDVGANQYLQKPFDLDELLSRVRNLLTWRAKPTPQRSVEALREYAFGRAKINFDTFEVEVDDQPARLTAMEMKLLRYFIENEGHVVSRSQLLRNVWGFDSSPTTRTVDNFVLRLRKVFEIDSAQPRHFVSVRGAGYRFVSRGIAGPSAGQ